MKKRTTSLPKRTTSLRLPGGSALHTGGGPLPKRVRWSVYKVERDRTVVPLGHVIAPHQPAALLAAFKRWPGELDATRPQAGLFVREYATDAFALGKRAPR